MKYVLHCMRMEIFLWGSETNVRLQLGFMGILDLWRIYMVLSLWMIDGCRCRRKQFGSMDRRLILMICLILLKWCRFDVMLSRRKPWWCLVSQTILVGWSSMKLLRDLILQVVQSAVLFLVLRWRHLFLFFQLEFNLKMRDRSRWIVMIFLLWPTCLSSADRKVVVGLCYEPSLLSIPDSQSSQ